MINILKNNINKIRVKPYNLIKKRFNSHFTLNNFHKISIPLSLCGGVICGLYGGSQQITFKQSLMENIFCGCNVGMLYAICGSWFTYAYILIFPISVPITFVSLIYSLLK